MGGLMGCAARGVQTVPPVQAHGVQPLSVAQERQGGEKPVSLETFSAFLDRG